MKRHIIMIKLDRLTTAVLISNGFLGLFIRMIELNR